MPHEFDIKIQLSIMRADLEAMRVEQPRDQLKSITPDDAYELGYETAIREIEKAIEGDTLEVRAVEIPVALADPSLWRADPEPDEPMFEGADLYFPREN